MLFALSRFSINCSKLSKAMSLFSSVLSSDNIAAIDCFIKSASEGPPKSELRASALIGRPEGRSALGSVVEVGSAEASAEFSMLHLRSWFMPGSMMWFDWRQRRLITVVCPEGLCEWN